MNELLTEKVMTTKDKSNIPSIIKWLKETPNVIDFSEFVELYSVSKEKNNYNFTIELLNNIYELSKLSICFQSTVYTGGNKSDFLHIYNSFSSNSISNIEINPVKKSEQQGSKSFVYIAKQMNENNYYKIGRTKNLQQRLKQFTTGNCFVELVASKMTNNASELELFLHKYYKSKNIKNEWFLLTKEDIEELLLVFNFTRHLGND